MTDTSPERILFASTTQSFLEKEASLSRLRELHAAGTSFEVDWWRRAAELGWTSLLVPEELGGGSVSGDGVADLALVAELAGKTVAPGPLHPVSTVLAGLAEAPEKHEDTIESLLSGEVVGSWAVYEPGKPWSPLDAAVTATRTETGYRIDGVKDRVEAGAESAVLLVVAQCDGAVRQFLVPTDKPGVRVEPQRSIDMVKSYARVHFDGVEVDADAAVGAAELTADLVARQSQIAMILQCAEIVGILETVLAFTIQWGFDRHSFGRPIGSYQALKHKYADLKIWFEACRATTNAAVAAVASRSPGADMAVSVAKSYVGEHAPGMLQDCIQLHGGIGVTWEHDLHLFLRRVTLYRSMFGTPEEHNLHVYALTDKAGARFMTDTTSAPTQTDESVEEFAARARAWLAQNMPRIDPDNPPEADRGEEAPWLRARELQKKLYEGGFAGICFPREYGGLGLPIAYQKAFDNESRSYELPIILNTPTFTICAATILDTGSEEQKRQHISGALRGDEVLVQLLSEPSGGSDLAGVITRADRVGDKWVINGAKTWSTSAFAADYGLMLARTNWDVPKHEGLTMFLVPINSPGITLRRIKQVNGSVEFCEEFFDNLELGDDAVVGEVNEGWHVASRQLYHERRAVGGGSEFASGIGAEGKTDMPIDYVALLEKAGQADNERAREMAGRALVHRAVREQLIDHVYHGVLDGSLPPAAGSIIRVMHAEIHHLEFDTAVAITGSSGVVDGGNDLIRYGERYLSRQTAALGGGTTEIARNIIGERVLGFPREYAADRGVPFNQVKRNRT